MDDGRWKFFQFLSCGFALLITILCFSCEKLGQNVQKISCDKPKTFLIQPFHDLNPDKVKFVADEIRKVYPNIKILEPISIPKEAFYEPRTRFRADTIIQILKKNANQNEVVLALTSKDISVTKGKNPDFGVMGLGYRPGKACVASNFRVKNNEQFFKVAIHELGHTQGLHHCPEKTCFIRDAEGGNPTDEEKNFCPKCKNFLKTKNWKFS